MLCWIDLETTGLNPETDRVLEVACIITDDALNEVARFQRVTSEARYTDLSRVDPHVLEMHVENGLWNESILRKALGPSLQQLRGDDGNIARMDEMLYGFIAANGLNLDIVIGDRGPQLAGSTVSFDRSFLKKHLPQSARLLHYRSLDVTTLNEFARRFFPKIHEGRPRGEVVHRAMPDIEASLAVARYYAKTFGRAVNLLEQCTSLEHGILPVTGEIGF